MLLDQDGEDRNMGASRNLDPFNLETPINSRRIVLKTSKVHCLTVLQAKTPKPVSLGQKSRCQQHRIPCESSRGESIPASGGCCHSWIVVTSLQSSRSASSNLFLLHLPMTFHPVVPMSNIPLPLLK